ncbi:3'(2'),5'-bisphosphate nucleotidase CysQ [Terrihabitans sp. B22-R8]|uniref:3'(2'),5'-bisphosphate nucleotidase CysQ n=1 Tax=Terrihabitans sp. B22-R8 TaxID=3425128 RepID=UPI00403D0175
MGSAISSTALQSLQANVAEIIREAGDIALDFARDGAKKWTKGDSSIVTEADIKVDRFLQARLTELDPDIGWLSEETTDTPERLEHERVWVVDPIDGTRAFVEGVPVWVVSIGLVEHGRPVLGTIFNPTRDEMFEALSGSGARLNNEVLSASVHPEIRDARVIGPRTMMEGLEGTGASVGIARAPYVYALAYRMASVAAGRVDAAIASTRAKDWDIAAADLILSEAGGALLELDGTLPIYNRPAPVHQPLIGAREPLNGALRLALTDAARQTNTWA